MNTYRRITQALLLLAVALVLPFAGMDLYYLAIRKLDVYFLYMLAVPAAVLSFFVAQLGIVVGYLNGWKEHAGRLGMWLIAAWSAGMSVLVFRFFFS